MENLLYTLLVLFFFACTTPKKALQKGKYKQAFRLAERQIKKGKNVDQNINILRVSGDKIIQDEIRRNQKLLQSDDVKDWIKVRKSYYKTLNTIGKANLTTDGAISDIYDKLCVPKYDLDEKIASVFFYEGNRLLNNFDAHGNKIDAQNAYFQYDDCIKNGGKTFFQDLDNLKEEARQLGIVYYKSHGLYHNWSLFLQPIPRDADFIADCIVDVDLGFIHTDISESSNTQSYTSQIQVDTRIETDTSGNTTSFPIYETISCTVETTTVNITKSQSVDIDVVDQTGQCSISSDYYTQAVEGSYEIISFDGNEDAVPDGISEKSAPAFFESGLEDDLRTAVMESF